MKYVFFKNPFKTLDNRQSMTVTAEGRETERAEDRAHPGSLPGANWEHNGFTELQRAGVWRPSELRFAGRTATEDRVAQRKSFGNALPPLFVPKCCAWANGTPQAWETGWKGHSCPSFERTVRDSNHHRSEYGHLIHHPAHAPQQWAWQSPKEKPL